MSRLSTVDTVLGASAGSSADDGTEIKLVPAKLFAHLILHGGKHVCILLCKRSRASFRVSIVPPRISLHAAISSSLNQHSFCPGSDDSVCDAEFFMLLVSPVTKRYATIPVGQYVLPGTLRLQSSTTEQRESSFFSDQREDF